MNVPKPCRAMHALMLACVFALFLLLQLAPSAYGGSAPISTGPAWMALAAPNAPQWYDGTSQASSITNCWSVIQGMPYQEDGIRTYVGFIGDLAVPKPAINEVYYVHVALWGMGNSCAGQRAYIDISLPQNTSLAISPASPVYCFYDNVAVTPASDCPQTLPNSSYNEGWYEIPAPASSSYTWPMPQGHSLEFQIPLRSSAKLSNSLFQAKVWALDGNSSPWLNPQVGVYVFSNDITILYDTPSTTGITDIHAFSTATVYTYGTVGTAYFDIGTDTNYTLFHDPQPITTAGPGWIVGPEDWRTSPGGPSVLQPDTLYHWRMRYVTGGQTYNGADQTFRTLRAGTTTVGNGQPSSCTQAAIASQLALATTQRVDFDCGTLPVTITLSSPLAISSDVTIDGGNRVTLDAGGTSHHIQFQAGNHLTLTQIALVNGNNTSGCGGSMTVPSGAWLTLDGARFLDNQLHTTIWTVNGAGAVCVQANGKADVENSLFTNNHGYLGGGIANYGTTAITHTVLTTNTASVGGALYNYSGLLSLAQSTVLSNTVTGNGGGLANDRGTATIQMSTLSGNVSQGTGGGLSTSGPLYLTNSTLSGNSANGNGGGMEVQDDFIFTDAMTLLNSTLANNTAGGQGGNIYRGAVASAKIKLKNTLVASGSPNNCDSGITSQGSNLESANTCGLTAASDKTNTNPKLGPLQNNGGTTNTRALLSGSPAINAGANAGCPATDERGVARPQGSACDIGAYEAQVSGASQLYLPFVRR